MYLLQLFNNTNKNLTPLNILIPFFLNSHPIKMMYILQSFPQLHNPSLLLHQFLHDNTLRPFYFSLSWSCIHFFTISHEIAIYIVFIFTKLISISLINVAICYLWLTIFCVISLSSTCLFWSGLLLLSWFCC